MAIDIKNNIANNDNIAVIKDLLLSSQSRQRTTKQRDSATPTLKEQETNKALNPNEIKGDEKKDIARELQDVLKLKIDHYMSRGLRFEIDDKLDIVVAKIVDKETGEVVRQIPPDEIVRILKHMKELKEQGLIVDKEV